MHALQDVRENVVQRSYFPLYSLTNDWNRHTSLRPEWSLAKTIIAEAGPKRH